MDKGSAFLVGGIPLVHPLNMVSAFSSMSIDSDNLQFSDFLERKLLGDILGMGVEN